MADILFALEDGRHKHKAAIGAHAFPGLEVTKLERNSVTQFQLAGREYTGKKLFVNNELVDLSSAETCNVSGSPVNLIASDGTDASASPSASTLYYAYMSNSQASYAASSLRLSATAPTDGYLASSGNGAHWRFVGAVYLDGSTQIAGDLNLCGWGVDTVITYLGSGIVRSSGTVQYYDILSLPGVVLLPGTELSIIAQVFGSQSVTQYLLTKIEENNTIVKGHSKQNPTAGQDVIAMHGFMKTSESIQQLQYDLDYFYYGGTTTTIFAGSVSTFLHLRRNTL